MIAGSQIERRLDEWLASQASSAGSGDVLRAVAGRVATTGQQRYVTQRLFGDHLGRSYQLRLALAVAGLIVGLLGAVVVGAALLRREPPVPQPTPAARNGVIAFAADGKAGDNFEGTEFDRNGDRDLYFVELGGRPKRVIGSGSDGWSQRCPTFLAGGRQLAYLELKLSSVATLGLPVASGLPFPSGQTPPPAPPPPTSGSPLWAVVVVDLDEDGTPEGEMARVEIPVWGMSCPAWSADGKRFVYSAGVEGAGALWVSTTDGQHKRLLTTSDAYVRAIDWSPDSKTIAVADVDGVALVPVDGGGVTTIPVKEPTSVAWSTAGTLLAYGAGSEIRVVREDGTQVAAITDAKPDAGVAWSPDGQWLATLDGARGLVRLRVSDNTSEHLPVTGFAFDGIHGWSPDGEWALMGYGGVDTPASLVAVPWDGALEPVVLFAPTFAIRGRYVDWQAVYP